MILISPFWDATKARRILRSENIQTIILKSEEFHSFFNLKAVISFTNSSGVLWGEVLVFGKTQIYEGSFESGKHYLQGKSLSMIDRMPTGIQLMGQYHTDWNLTGYASWMMQTLKPIVA